MDELETLVGKPKNAGEYDDRSFVRAADGTHWLHHDY